MKYLVVFVVGFLLGGWAVPLGFVLDMEAPTVFLVAAGGGLFGCWLFLLAGERIERHVHRGRPPGDRSARDGTRPDGGDAASGRIARLVDRYGAKGLGIVGPIVPGVTATVIGGLAIGVDRRELGKWLSIGIIVMYGLYTSGVALLMALW